MLRCVPAAGTTRRSDGVVPFQNPRTPCWRTMAMDTERMFGVMCVSAPVVVPAATGVCRRVLMVSSGCSATVEKLDESEPAKNVDTFSATEGAEVRVGAEAMLSVLIRLSSIV
eukprot:Amastigsp_a508724_1240.p4 type:complete len:113 gc:universal Amastigsp_a508724_1240:639-977(+)